MNIDSKILSEENLQKIRQLNNPNVERIVEEYVNLCKPAKVSVITDSFPDIGYVRQQALELGEEIKGFSYGQAAARATLYFLIVLAVVWAFVAATREREG